MDELTNQLVWVHPHTKDPLDRQGNFGRITNVRPDLDETEITFTNGQRGIYQLDNLYLLKPSVLLYESISLNAFSSWYDRRAMLDMYLLAYTGKIENIEKATEMATQNLAMADSAMVSLRQWLELRLGRIVDKPESFARRR